MLATEKERNQDAQMSAFLLEEVMSAALQNQRITPITKEDDSDASPDPGSVRAQDIRASAEKVLYTYLLPGSEREIILPSAIIREVTKAMRGAPNIARLSVVCKDWEKEIQSRRARVPQKKKKREKGKHGNIVRVAAVLSLPNPTSTSASPPSDIDNLESSLPPDHPDAEYLNN
ncbi:hypothetical protein ACEPPN_018859 [Leptodophora sp. 'Broadleaf-Isolate-01']